MLFPRKSETIRGAAVGEGPALAAVHVRAWQQTYRGTLSDDFLDGLDLEQRARWFDDRIAAGALVLVDESEDGVAGFCFADESSEPGWGEILSIHVDPAFWGQGHGRRLLQAAEQEMSKRGFDVLLLWVLESNHRARAFYERQGWKLGRRMRIEQIGGVQVTEVRYEKTLRVET